MVRPMPADSVPGLPKRPRGNRWNALLKKDLTSFPGMGQWLRGPFGFEEGGVRPQPRRRDKEDRANRKLLLVGTSLLDRALEFGKRSSPAQPR